MALVKQIQNWFAKNGSFIEGTTLLMQTGANTARFQRYFSAPYVPEPVERQLRTLLTAYLDIHANDLPVEDAQAVETAPEASKMTENRTNVQNSVIPNLEEPLQILALRQEARKLHKRQAMLHGQLSVVATDGERYELAKEIMEEVIPNLDRIYDTIRAWEKTGDLPTAAKSDDGFRRGVELMKRLNSLKPRISRLKSLLKKTSPDPDERQKYEKELKEKELEVLEIEEQINL